MIVLRFGRMVRAARRASASRVPEAGPFNWDSLQQCQLRAKQRMC